MTMVQMALPLTTGGYVDPYPTACLDAVREANIDHAAPFPPSILRSNLQTGNNVITDAPKKKKETPAIGSLGKEGMIMCRTSIFTLILRRWADSYWLHVHPTTILVFKTKELMDKWKMLHRTGKDGAKDSDTLIQWSLDFDTSGVVHKKMVKAEKKRCKLMNIPPPKLKTKIDDNYKYAPPINYAMEEVRSKYYNGRNGPLMHTCKISYLTSQGRTIAVAFGSTESPDLKQLRATIRYCIKLVIKYTNKKRKQSNVDNQENCNDTVDGGSAITGTELSAGYSAVASEFSNTVYGRNTMTPSTLNWVEANK